jgi:hypothetical protein
MDRGLQRELHAQKEMNEIKKPSSIKEIRVKLEAEQKKELESYEWTDKDKGVARIPVARGLSYYLRSLPRK